MRYFQSKTTAVFHAVRDMYISSPHNSVKTLAYNAYCGYCVEWDKVDLYCGSWDALAQFCDRYEMPEMFCCSSCARDPRVRFHYHALTLRKQKQIIERQTQHDKQTR